MRSYEEFGNFRRQAHLITLRVACLWLVICSLPKVGYSAAIMVRQNINLNGNNVTIDSYNSSDPTKSVNGQWAASVSGDAGDVICAGGITNSASIGNANIYGRLYVASGVGVSLGANGAIGTHAWLLAGNYGIEPGYLVPNASFPFPNISLPYPSGLYPEPGTVVTTNSGVLVTNNYDDVLFGANFFTTSALGNTIVTGPATLVLPNGYSIGHLTIVPGASLAIYVGGAGSISINANTISNEAGLPSSLAIYCTSDVTNLLLSGNAAFSGVILAPNANATINGGATEIDYSGAIMIKSLTMNGHVNFHFDEALVQQRLVPPYPSDGASLNSPAISGSGHFQFHVSGVAGFSYTVESSSNLTDWVPLLNTSSWSFTFTDTNASAVGQNFFRAVYYQQ